MSGAFFTNRLYKLSVALLLTCASGLVDIVGYIGVYHFFTAHLTGTTVHLGHSLVTHEGVDIIAALLIVAAFVGGSILGRVLIEVGSRRRFRRIASVTLALEALALVIVAEGALNLAGSADSRLALLAAAMGLQTATLTGIGPLTVHTTFVTGMLNKVAQLVSHISFRAYDALKKPRSPDAHHAQEIEIQMTLFLIAVWLFYVLGAALGTWVLGYWGLRTLFIAVGLLCIGITVDQFRPLSIEEEKEQAER